MIRIKCGTCGTSQGYRTQANGAFTLPASEEARLVARGVAVYATTPIIGDAPNASSDGAELSASAVKASQVSGASYLDIVDGHFTKESLLKMGRSDMESLAADLGIDVKKCKTKDEISELLAAVEVNADADADGEQPPTLSAEDIVQ
jgi:hypothetical protein